MSTTAIPRVDLRRVMKVDGLFRHATRDLLLLCWADRRPVTIHDARDGLFHHGVILDVRLESGCTDGKPAHFLVTIRTWNATVADIYLRTAA